MFRPKRPPSKALLLGGAAALFLAIPALGQEGPEVLLPPGFGDPETPLPPRVEQPERPRPDAPPAPPRAAPAPAPAPADPGDPLDAPPPVPRGPDIPAHAQRPVDRVGVLGPANWGLAEDAFGGANGLFLSGLMRRLDAPLPSRWTSMLLRRALLSRVPAPPQVDPVDWVAQRAWLLLRMGEADAARMLVQGVDTGNYTPQMIAVAVQTALATADPAALCPLVEAGRRTSDEPVWPLSAAMCAALEGEAARASALVDQARRRSGARGADLLLAEKVVGAGTDTRRAVTIQWEEVDSLNAWRFGLASATGVEIPARLMEQAGPQVHAWHARAPMVPLNQRLGSAQVAASLGVFSSAALVELHSLVLDNTDPAEIADTTGARLRTAYAARDLDERMAALRTLWQDADTPHQRHAQRILTAGAASRIPPSEELATDADDLVAAMLSAGLDQHAARWSEVVQADGGDRAWALLALGSPRPAVEISPGRIEAFRNRDNSPGRHRSKMLLAALAGLGRVPAGAESRLAGAFEVDLGRQTRWSRVLDTAVRNRQPGTVALLSAVGMQTRDWRGVPPHHLYHIVRALSAVGLEYEARMIAAEALSRL